jgi:hypothetical protein
MKNGLWPVVPIRTMRLKRCLKRTAVVFPNGCALDQAGADMMADTVSADRAQDMDETTALPIPLIILKASADSPQPATVKMEVYPEQSS